jgi:hypothetical protein
MQKGDISGFTNLIVKQEATGTLISNVGSWQKKEAARNMSLPRSLSLTTYESARN